MAVEMLAFLELVHRAAIGALGLAATGHIKIDLGVAVPKRHVGQWAGAINPALMVQVFGQQFYGCVCHGGLSNQLGTELVHCVSLRSVPQGFRIFEDRARSLRVALVCPAR